MGKASSSKKVEKAAKAGGGVSRRAGSTSTSFTATVLGVCIAGIALVVGSIIGRTVLESPPYAAPTSKKLASTRDDYQSALKKVEDLRKKKAPQKEIDAAVKELKTAADAFDKINSATHIHAAYGIYNCDKYEPPFDGSVLDDPLGIHAHEDGLIHTHPIGRNGSGNKATLKLFFEATKLTVTDEKLQWIANASGTKFTTLDVKKNKCGKDKKDAVVSILYWKDAQKKNEKAQRFTGDFGKLKITANSAFAFVFAPEGTVVPLPPTVSALEAPADVDPEQQTAAEAAAAAAGGTVSTVVVPSTVAGASTTAAPASTTAAPASSSAPATTAAPASTAVPSTAAVDTTAG